MNLFEDDTSQFQDWNDEVNGSNEVDENVIDFYAILNVPRDVCIFPC